MLILVQLIKTIIRNHLLVLFIIKITNFNKTNNKNNNKTQNFAKTAAAQMKCQEEVHLLYQHILKKMML